MSSLLLDDFTFSPPLKYDCADRSGEDCEKHVVFYDEGHKYVDNLNRDVQYTSATTLIHGYFPEFNSKIISEKVSTNPKSEYYGRDPAEIRRAWDANRDDAATRGTAMHAAIESIYNGIPRSEPVKELSLFKKFHNDLVDRIPYRTEQVVCLRRARICGSVDMIYKDGAGNDHVYDWKRSKEIKMEARDYGFEPLSDFQNTNYSHYCLQLNLYGYILDTMYGYRVKSMTLVILHPAQDTYLLVPVPDLRERVLQMLEDFIGHGFMLPHAYHLRFDCKDKKDNRDKKDNSGLVFKRKMLPSPFASIRKKDDTDDTDKGDKWDKWDKGEDTRDKSSSVKNKTTLSIPTKRKRS